MLLKRDMNKTEIEEFLKGKGDFVQIDHLTRLLEDKQLPLDRRKFVCQKLAEIYARKNMFTEAAKMYNNISIASTTFAEKINSHVKEAEMYIKGGALDDADEAIKKSIGEANAGERANIQKTFKEFYRRQAEAYEKQHRRSNAVKIYEKLLQMSITDAERMEIKSKLIVLYESLGKVKEYMALKGNK